MSTVVLDVTGQLCPIPVIRVQNRIKTLENGDILEVHCTDPGALSDIPAWCRVHGHQVVKAAPQGTEIVITIAVQGEKE